MELVQQGWVGQSRGKMPLVWFFEPEIGKIEGAGMGDHYAASEPLLQTVGEFVPIPSHVSIGSRGSGILPRFFHQSRRDGAPTCRYAFSQCHWP